MDFVCFKGMHFKNTDVNIKFTTFSHIWFPSLREILTTAWRSGKRRVSITAKIRIINLSKTIRLVYCISTLPWTKPDKIYQQQKLINDYQTKYFICPWVAQKLSQRNKILVLFLISNCYMMTQHLVWFYFMDWYGYFYTNTHLANFS